MKRCIFVKLIWLLILLPYLVCKYFEYIPSSLVSMCKFYFQERRVKFKYDFRPDISIRCCRKQHHHVFQYYVNSKNFSLAAIQTSHSGILSNSLWTFFGLRIQWTIPLSSRSSPSLTSVLEKENVFYVNWKVFFFLSTSFMLTVPDKKGFLLKVTTLIEVESNEIGQIIISQIKVLNLINKKILEIK